MSKQMTQNLTLIRFSIQIKTFTPQIHNQICGSDSDSEPLNKTTP